METTIIYANHVLTSVLVSSNCQEPVKLHDHSSDASCKIWWLSTSEIYSSVSSIRKKLSYRKHVHHNSSSKYATRKWLHFLWDKPFPEVRTNPVENMKTQRWKVPWPNNELHFSCSRTKSILPVSLFAPHLYSQ